MQINGIIRLASEPESKYTASGICIVSFSGVSGEKYKDKEDTCFIDCVVFGALGEKVVMKYLKKGSQVYIQGKLKQEKWTAQDGTNRSKHSVTVENLQMLGSKQDRQESPQEHGYEVEVERAQPAHEPIHEFDIDLEMPF